MPTVTLPLSRGANEVVESRASPLPPLVASWLHALGLHARREFVYQGLEGLGGVCEDGERYGQLEGFLEAVAQLHQIKRVKPEIEQPAIKGKRPQKMGPYELQLTVRSHDIRNGYIRSHG